MFYDLFQSCPRFLVGISEAPHSAHHTQHIIVGSEHIHSGAGGGAHGVVGHGQHQGRVIDTGQVASAAGLVLLRVQGEGVHVNTHRRDVGVVLVGLHLVEVAALTHLEAVVAVQLQQSRHGRIATSHALHAGDGETRLQHGAVPPVREVEGLLALPGVHDSVIARHEGIALHNPHQLLARVVEVQLQLVGAGSNRLTTGELQGLNQVLVADLGELAALVRVQVDVVHIQGGRLQIGRRHTVADGVGVGANLGGDVPAQIAQVVELQIDADLVVLQSNQGQSQTRIAAEPELQGNVQRVGRRAVEHLRARVGLAGSAVAVAALATLHKQVGQLGHVTNHLGVASLLAGLLGQLIPDVQPVAIVLVDALATNLNLNGLDQVVANPVEPAPLGTRAVAGLQGHLGQSRLQVDAVNQVTVALNRAGHTLAEAGRAVERVLNRLHGEVGVATIDRLEKGNLRVTRQIDILSTVCDELHQTTTCHFLYHFQRKLFWRRQPPAACRRVGYLKIHTALTK
jgi:hypothetical protein